MFVRRPAPVQPQRTGTDAACEEVAKRLNTKFLNTTRTDCNKAKAGMTGSIVNATGRCECQTGFDDALASCVTGDTAAEEEERKGYETFYYAAAATVVPTFLGTAAVGTLKLGPVKGTLIAVAVSSRIFDMETDWALYALSLQNPTLDREMCGFDGQTDETVCDATDHLRTSALTFSIVSSVGLIPHLLSLYTRVAPGTETDPGSLELAAGLLTCIIVFEDIPQIVISAM